jgi:RND family efflux transporter MFP subunit
MSVKLTLMRPPRFVSVLLLAVACAKSRGGPGTANGATGGVAAGDVADSGVARATLTLPVSAEPAIDGDLVLTVTTTGLVRSESETRLKAAVGGTIDSMLAHPGDHVTKGQPIIKLAQYEFDLAIRTAQAGVNQASVVFQDYWAPDSIATGKSPSAERRQSARVRSGLEAAELHLEGAKFDKARSTITAPFDGIIDHLDVSIGESIAAGTVVTVLVDDKNLHIEAAVLEHDIGLIRAGGEALVTSSAAPGAPVQGRIVSVLPMIDSISRAGRAYVRVQGNDVLRPGMYADVKLEAQRLPHRRLVPTRAIIQRDGRDLVFVVKNGRAEWTYVVPGRSNGVQTEILPDTAGPNPGQIPVKRGDLVIVEGHLTLTHDAPVRVVSKSEPDSRK